MKKKIIRLVKTECACESCQSACTKTPGWFRPGEAEKAAKLLRLSLPVFFRRYLAVQWWSDTPDVFVLAPALVGERTGAMYPGNPRGTCVFFKSGKCQIHAAKPFDCSHGNPHDPFTGAKAAAAHRARARTVALWKREQKQIAKLLGRKPRAAMFSFFDMLDGMFS